MVFEEETSSARREGRGGREGRGATRVHFDLADPLPLPFPASTTKIMIATRAR